MKIKGYNKFKEEYKESDKFSDIVWAYYKSIDAPTLFRNDYCAQLEYDGIDQEEMELDDKQLKLAKKALKEKIKKIKNGDYDNIFEKTLKEEVETNIKFSKGETLGGLVPEEFLDFIFKSDNGAMYFFDMSIEWDNDKPVIKLDLDNNEIDWQAFD